MDFREKCIVIIVTCQLGIEYVCGLGYVYRVHFLKKYLASVKKRSAEIDLDYGFEKKFNRLFIFLRFLCGPNCGIFKKGVSKNYLNMEIIWGF